MTAWGDRLWSFGAGIFINLLAPENLRLVAIYGFATSVSVIFFGAGFILTLLSLDLTKQRNYNSLIAYGIK